jgi:hypothetical protein
MAQYYLEPEALEGGQNTHIALEGEFFADPGSEGVRFHNFSALILRIDNNGLDLDQ